MSVNPRDLKKLKNHWRELISQSQYHKKLELLSEKIGKKPSYLRSTLVNTSMPSVDVLIGLSKELGVPVGYLLMEGTSAPINATEIGESISREVSRVMTEKLWGKSQQPTSDDVVDWWRQNGGRLENYDRIDGKFDLFDIPDTSHRNLLPVKIGELSLSSLSLRTNSIDVFNRTVCPLPERYRHLILTAHRSSIERGPMTTMETLDAIHPDSGLAIQIEYLRTLVPVTLPDDRKLVLNYSKLLRKTSEVPSDVLQVGSAGDDANL